MEGRSSKRCAIIGAGASGIAAVKICLEYGFEPVCFEKTHDIGGLWRYKPHECEGEASVMRSTIINTSKEMMAYSDFPPPEEYPNFMHNTLVIDYFRAYIEKFDLLKHIRFNTIVTSLKKANSFDLTGQWTLSITDMTNNNVRTSTETFDAVFICTGHHAEPYFPVFQGQEHFSGQIVHSHSYKESSPYAKKNVVVVGIGNSGGDIAVELAGQVARHPGTKVYLSTRSGCWVNTKIMEAGFPYDTLFITRFGAFLQHNFDIFTHGLTALRCNLRFNHKLYGLKPTYKTFQQHIFLNEDLPIRIVEGALQIKPNIREFCSDGRSIVFVDGTRAENIDVVMLATGYSVGFPILDDASLIPIDSNRVSLFKYIFPPDLAHPTLVTIGLIQPVGALMPIAEMQCRLVCDVLSGRTRLPPRAVMWKDIERRRTFVENRWIASRRHTIQVYYVYYMDELAGLIGAKVNFGWKFLIEDPICWIHACFGPCTPYQFRLVGPHAWSGARQAIMSGWSRIIYPLDPEGRRREDMLNRKRSPFWREANRLKIWMKWILCLILVPAYYGFLALLFTLIDVDIF